MTAVEGGHALSTSYDTVSWEEGGQFWQERHRPLLALDHFFCVFAVSFLLISPRTFSRWIINWSPCQLVMVIELCWITCGKGAVASPLRDFQVAYSHVRAVIKDSISSQSVIPGMSLASLSLWSFQRCQRNVPESLDNLEFINFPLIQQPLDILDWKKMCSCCLVLGDLKLFFAWKHLGIPLLKQHISKSLRR